MLLYDTENLAATLARENLRSQSFQRLAIPPGVKLFGFADDITLVVYVPSIKVVELTAQPYIMFE